MILNIANSDSKEAAYLVSIIDTANLNIADNDLTIDKIKLALEDMKFTDGVDAATVYAAIISETDEGELEKLLTKQESKDFRVTHETLYTDFDEENVLRTLAIFKIACPNASIRLAGGKKARLSAETIEKAFKYCVDSTIVGNYLTTTGFTPEDDAKLIAKIGRKIK